MVEEAGEAQQVLVAMVSSSTPRVFLVPKYSCRVLVVVPFLGELKAKPSAMISTQEEDSDGHDKAKRLASTIAVFYL